MRAATNGILLAVIATFFFSTSPIFTRLASGLSPAQVTFSRMFGGGLFLLLFSYVYKMPITIITFQKRYLIFGIITALHFLFYIWSLYYTSIAHTLVIVYTAPVYVYIYEIIKGYKPTIKELSGALLAIIGLAILVGFQPEVDLVTITGNVMAFFSALCLAVYSIVGRKEKDKMALIPYAFWLYMLSSLFLFPFALPTFQISLQPIEILSLLGLALLPTALGHTLYNAALRQIRSFIPSIIATQEVTGGILLGIVFLAEIPTTETLVGAIISLAGIITVIYTSHKKVSTKKT